MKKTIVVFLMLCSSVQARQAVGLIVPIQAADVSTPLNDGEADVQKTTSTEPPTSTAYISIEDHIYAVTNDAFAKIKLVGDR